MGFAEVGQWVRDLSYGLGVSGSNEDEYNECITTLAEDGRLWFAHFSRSASALDEELHRVPDALVKILAVFYDDRMLTWETQRSMEALDPQWRQQRHTPKAYITDNVEDRYIRLWPPGDHDCEDLGWLYTRRLKDAPPFMDLPLAFLTLAREFARESDHRDLEFAGLAQKLADQMLEMCAA
jgi:hypothetical protein